MEQHVKIAKELTDAKCEQQLAQKKLEDIIASLEAEKITKGALHKAELSDMQQKLQLLSVQGQENKQWHEQELKGLEIALKEQVVSSKEAADIAALQHAQVVAELQALSKNQIAEQNLRLQVNVMAQTFFWWACVQDGHYTVSWPRWFFFSSVVNSWSLLCCSVGKNLTRLLHAVGSEVIKQAIVALLGARHVWHRHLLVGERGK